MSFRWKVFLISVAIMVFILGTTIGSSLLFIHRGIKDTVLNDISVMARIAEKLVSSEINLLKARAWNAVHRLDFAPEDRWRTILEDMVESRDYFLSITIAGKDGQAIVSYGYPTAPPELIDSPYAKMAFDGQTVISTTRSVGSGELVFHICVPIDDDRIGAVSIPGLYFSKLLEAYHIWGTGSIFILDETGKTLANERTHLVLGEYNAAENTSGSINSDSNREFVRRMIQGGEGHGWYVMENVKRLVYFVSVADSGVGWSLGVSAPLKESPLTYVDQAVILMTLVFFGVGLIAAWLASGFVDRQFALINEQYRNLAELSSLARSSSEAKSNFLANMSHEMRTPLNAIIGFSELIIYGRYSSQERRECLEKIHTAGLTLLGIVNDILDISKIESGLLELIEEEYDVSSLINDTVTVNLIRIEEKPIEFGLKIDKTIPCRLLGDELRIKQICSNILSNAFKYTQEGRVEMKVSCLLEEDRKCWLTVSVKDSGIGIRPEDVAKLFSAYSQVDTKSNRKIEGTGLGLSITKRMVEMMSGGIEVESVYGQGSTFTFTVLQTATTEIPIGQEVVDNLEGFNFFHTRGSAKYERKIIPMPYARILLVDDVQANLDVAKGVMKPYGMQIDCVTSGQSAVDLVRTGNIPYSAIFMDHMMPGMDGIEAVRIIRQEIDSDYARNVPIIALTANAIIGNDKMFLENGFQAFLSKPIEIHRMDQVLRQWVRDKELEQEWEDKAQEDPLEHDELTEFLKPSRTRGPEAAAVLAVPGLELEEAMARFGGDYEVLLTVLNSYADNMPGLLSQLKDPDKEKLKDYTIVVHGIKSSSYGVGAREVGDLAKALEDSSEAGDFEFVQTHNPRFLIMVEKLVADIKETLAPRETAGSREVKPRPDSALLDKLFLASQAYDMDGVESCLIELEKYSYQNGGRLVALLREKTEQTAFSEIAEILADREELLSEPSGQAGFFGPPSGPDEPEHAEESSGAKLKEPDFVLLSRLAAAAGAFKMDKVDDLIEELTSADYEQHKELVDFLAEKVQAMEFTEIHDRIMEQVKDIKDQGLGLKQLKGAPEPDILDSLRKSCQNYDMDGVDRAMTELDKYRYGLGQELIDWLRDKIMHMEFDQIVGRLSLGA